MFKKRAFQVKIIDDPDVQVVPAKEIDYDKIEEIITRQIKNVVVGAVVIYTARSLSYSLNSALTQLAYVKIPFPPRG